MRELIQRIAQKHVHESEVYVDADGWAYDDEGNRWKVSGASQGHYGGRQGRQLTRSASSSRLSKERQAAWDRVKAPHGGRYPTADQRSARREVARIDRTVRRIKELQPRVAAMRHLYPDNDFLKSLQSQLNRERPLTSKQVVALEKFEARSKTQGAHRGTKPSGPKAPPSEARATPRVPGARAKDPVEGNAQLVAMDALLQRKRGDRFLLSLRDQVARGRRLSDKQKSALLRNFSQMRMDAEAKLFESVYVV